MVDIWFVGQAGGVMGGTGAGLAALPAVRSFGVSAMHRPCGITPKVSVSEGISPIELPP